MKSNQNLYSLPTIHFEHFPSKEAASIVSLSEFEAIPNLVSQVTTICRSEPNYSILFKELPFISAREGKDPKYAEEDAEFWVSSFVEAWNNKGQNVVFLVVKKNLLLGAIEVRQKNSETAELGYWSNPEFTGYMTNALKAFVSQLKKVGFQSVYALTKSDNKRSQRLLERVNGKKVSYEDKRFDKYDL